MNVYFVCLLLLKDSDCWKYKVSLLLPSKLLLNQSKHAVESTLVMRSASVKALKVLQ